MGCGWCLAGVLTTFLLKDFGKSFGYAVIVVVIGDGRKTN